MSLLILLSALLLAVTCLGENRVVFKKTIAIDKGQGKRALADVVVLKGEEPADAVFRQMRPHNVDGRGRRAILDEIRKEGAVPISRDHALVLSQPLDVEGRSGTELTFDMYDDGTEPVDALYDFARAHGLVETHYGGLVEALLPRLCELLPCSRDRARIWHGDVVTDGGTSVGRLEILDGDEAADTVDSFVAGISEDVGDRATFRRNLLGSICESIACARRVPVVYRKRIKDEFGNSAGAVEVLEGEEVADATARFLRTTEVRGLDEVSLKNFLFRQACGNERVSCTRSEGVVYNELMRFEDSDMGTIRLTIFDTDEPADRVLKWCRDNGISLAYMSGVLDRVCDAKMVVCKRRQAVYFSMSVSGPDGSSIGTLQLMLGNEPVDDVYQFFASNGLFSKGWDFHGFVRQICDKPDVDCRRHTAIKYYDDHFAMGNVTMGKLVIWEDQEVVDVLFNLRRHYNLTLEDQINKQNEICKKPEVHCRRLRAVVHRKTDITALDYQKFGNETCKRQLVGVKFLTSFASLPFGDKVAEQLKKDHVKKVVEHPLFCVGVLISLHFILLLVFKMSPLRTRRLHMAQRTYVSLWLVVLVSVMQAAFIEPDTQVDIAMHAYEGKLPDLVIHEDVEPVDALIVWAKLASKDHQPIVRESIYHEILDELCNQTETLACTRTRAFEKLELGKMTYFGEEYGIQYYNPSVDPMAQRNCTGISGGNANSCMEEAASLFCSRLIPPPENCVRDLTAHIASQVQAVDQKRLDGKETYSRLGLEMDAPGHELYKKSALLARQRGMNISPFRRVDNGTMTFDKWSTETTHAHTVVDTFMKIHDPEAREWNDKPCTPYFGGALCAKYDKDGNMLIEV